MKKKSQVKKRFAFEGPRKQDTKRAIPRTICLYNDACRGVQGSSKNGDRLRDNKVSNVYVCTTDAYSRTSGIHSLKAAAIS